MPARQGPAKPCEAPKAVFKNLNKGKHKVSVVVTDDFATPATAKQRFKVT